MSRRIFLTLSLLTIGIACLGDALKSERADALARSKAATQVPDPQLQKVLADWNKRQGRIASVRYRVTGKGVIPKGGLALIGPQAAADHPPRELNVVANSTLLLDVAKGKYRFEIEEEKYDKGTDKLYPAFHTRTFDGITVAGYTPAERNTHPVFGNRKGEPEIGFGTGYLGGSVIEGIHWPFFYGHGIVPTRSKGIGAANLKVAPDMKHLKVHAKSILNGIPCLVLRTSPPDKGFITGIDEIWVDLGRDSAVVKVVNFVGDRVNSEFTMDYKETAKGWLLSRWAFRNEPKPGQIALVQHMHVVAIDIEPAVKNEDYQIIPKPGQRIVEYVHTAPAPGKAAPQPATKIYDINAAGGKVEVPPTKLPAGK